MSNVIPLHVHKNTKEQREKREIRQTLKDAVREGLTLKNGINGYALVIWDAEGNCFSSYMSNSKQYPVQIRFLPQFVEETLRRSITHQMFNGDDSTVLDN